MENKIDLQVYIRTNLMAGHEAGELLNFQLLVSVAVVAKEILLGGNIASRWSNLRGHRVVQVFKEL